MGNGGDGADLDLFEQTLAKEGSDFLPRAELREAGVDFFHCFRVECRCSFGCGRGRVGAVGDGCIELLQGPFVSDFHRTAFCAELDEHFAGRMVLCEGSGEHEATGRHTSIKSILG